MEAQINTKILFTVKCELTEAELRALDALVGYGFNEFVNCFYTHMGKAYLEPFENDLRQLFKKVESLRPEIGNINKARKALSA